MLRWDVAEPGVIVDSEAVDRMVMTGMTTGWVSEAWVVLILKQTVHTGRWDVAALFGAREEIPFRSEDIPMEACECNADSKR